MNLILLILVPHHTSEKSLDLYKSDMLNLKTLKGWDSDKYKKKTLYSYCHGSLETNTSFA